jgi:hypothetical protein
MYWLASRTVAKDLADTHAALLATASEKAAASGEAAPFPYAESDHGPDSDVAGDLPVDERLTAEQDPRPGR